MNDETSRLPHATSPANDAAPPLPSQSQNPGGARSPRSNKSGVAVGLGTLLGALLLLYGTGTYIVRMDQPYSRIADTLLDYQYWAASDPQKSIYDDTGWT